ncbi:hypothetical protein ABZP36_013786 [Zizania latifolia]
MAVLHHVEDLVVVNMAMAKGRYGGGSRAEVKKMLRTGRGTLGPRPAYQGGRRGGFGNDSERLPRRTYERHGYEMKREGAGRGNWGTTTDKIIAHWMSRSLFLRSRVHWRMLPGQANENKDTKDATPNVEEKEEDKSEERKVEIDKDLQSMQPLSNKKENYDVFIKLIFLTFHLVSLLRNVCPVQDSPFGVPLQAAKLATAAVLNRVVALNAGAIPECFHAEIVQGDMDLVQGD